MKILIYIVICYLIYRVFLKDFINPGVKKKQQNQKEQDGDYIDYEEVD